MSGEWNLKRMRLSFTGKIETSAITGKLRLKRRPVKD